VDAGNVFAVRCRNEWDGAIRRGNAGIAWNIDTLAELVNANRLALEVGVVATEGINGSPLSGVGIFAGTRIEL